MTSANAPLPMKPQNGRQTSRFGWRLWLRLRSSWRRRLWWFDVVYPIALATFLFGSLTYIVFEGQRQWRLALQAEKQLMDFSLKEARDRPVRTPGQVLIVNAEPAEIGNVGRAPAGDVPEASADAYALVIERLGVAGVPLLFVHWDTDAHPLNDAYYAALRRTLQQIPKTTKVYLITPPEARQRIPEGIRQLVTWADDGVCQEVEEVQTECSYLPEYDDWVIQALLDELVAKPATSLLAASQTKTAQPLPPWVSTQLTSVFPRYMLNLSAPQALTAMSFAQVLSPALPPGLGSYRIAIIGANQVGAISGRGSGSATRQVRTVYDQAAAKGEIAGTPLHVFWAQLAQMYLDQAMIVVPSVRFVAFATVGFCLLVTLVMTVFGGPAALGVFFVVVLCGPYVNALAIRHLQVYLPLFDSYYFGLTTIVVVGLTRLSVTAFHRWRLAARRGLQARIADLKGNFISLLSHNLNTPVAKMQGMLGLLAVQASQAGDKSWQEATAEAEALVTQLEYTVRSVLVASALEERVLTESSRTVRTLADELSSSMSSSLKRLGIKLRVDAPTADDDEGLFLPLTIDVRALTAAVSAMAALFHEPKTAVTVNVHYHVRAPAAGAGHGRTALEVSVNCKDIWLPTEVLQVLARIAAPPLRSLGQELFFKEILAGMAVLAVRTYNGRIVVPSGSAPAAAGGTLVASFVLA